MKAVVIMVSELASNICQLGYWTFPQGSFAIDKLVATYFVDAYI